MPSSESQGEMLLDAVLALRQEGVLGMAFSTVTFKLFPWFIQLRHRRHSGRGKARVNLL